MPGGKNVNIMLGPYKIVVDTWAEVRDLLKPYADEEFWQFREVNFDPAKFYIIGRLQLKENWDLVTRLANDFPGRIIFCNPAEGSETIILQLKRLRITDYVRQGKILLLTSGDLEPGFNHTSTDGYFSHIVEYIENQQAAFTRDEIYNITDKPYDFLFLNGRLRPHRKYLIHLMRQRGLLDRALWTCLQANTDMVWSSQLNLSDINDPEPIRLLPPEYEIDRARDRLSLELPTRDIKHFIFNNTWGDAIVNPKCYHDTYFSVVTETIFDYPYTFRTEKIWKPILMGHPWITVANRGYYRDLRNQGFQTFNSLIDESFDGIDDPHDRINRVIQVIADILSNGAGDFLQKSKDICVYNQQRLIEYNREQRSVLPGQLERYIQLNERS